MTTNEITQAFQIIPTVPTTDRLLWGARLNHNEPVLRGPRALRALSLNHSETVLAARPVGRGINVHQHSETVLAARPVGRGINVHQHSETVLAAH